MDFVRPKSGDFNVTLAKIQGLVLRPLVRHADERGDFRELLRTTDAQSHEVLQVSTSYVLEGIAKAWHLHWDQTESMTIAVGVARFAFCDKRPHSKTFGETEDFLIDAASNPMLFTVAPGIAHGYRILKGPGVIVYLTNRIYDPEDQIKIPAETIDYDWGTPSVR